MSKERAMGANESLKAYWEQGRGLINKIEQEGGMQAHVDTSDPVEIERAFRKQHCLCCMDERVPSGVHLPGSGIFEMDEQKRASLVAECRKNGITDVSLHKGCGAVGLYAKLHHLTVPEAEAVAEKWARDLSEELGGSFQGVADVRPNAFHIAHGAYYDTTGLFEPSRSSDVFPTGFVISRSFTDAPNAVQALEVGFDIATGDHGFGEQITPENPFFIVVVANTEAEAEQSKREILVSRHIDSRRVRIDSFVPPAVVKEQVTR